MAISKFNLNLHQRAERKLLITVAEWRDNESGKYYILQDKEPGDWDTNYKDYYTQTAGTPPTYTPVTGDTAPAWAASTYYTRVNREILGRRTEDSSIEYNADIATSTDILGINYTDINKTQPQQDFAEGIVNRFIVTILSENMDSHGHPPLHLLPVCHQGRDIRDDIIDKYGIAASIGTDARIYTPAPPVLHQKRSQFSVGRQGFIHFFLDVHLFRTASLTASTISFLTVSRWASNAGYMKGLFMAGLNSTSLP